MEESSKFGNENGEDQERSIFWTKFVKESSPKQIVQMLVQKEKEADMDHLTNIWNKRGWEKQVELLSGLSERSGETISFLFIDIDDFKYINDHWSHEVGDHSLIFVSKVLKDRLRKTDVLARIGGDEFGVLLPSTNNDEINIIRKGLVEELDREFSKMDDDDELKAIRLSLSIGVSTKGQNEDPKIAIDRADQNMYEVKGNKKNV